jgi:hypothetical protein
MEEIRKFVMSGSDDLSSKALKGQGQQQASQGYQQGQSQRQGSWRRPILGQKNVNFNNPSSADVLQDLENYQEVRYLD